jgi:hypothetical protein
MLKLNLTYGLILILIILAGKTSYAQEQPFKVERAPFSNRTYDEWAPVLINGDIVFRSNKRLSATTKTTDKNNKMIMNMFVVRDMGDGEWSDPALFANELSELRNHYGPAVFNENGRRIWFNKINMESNPDRAKIGIYSGEYIGSEWTNIEPFEYNDPRYSFMHPFISEDGRMLFFASDQPGGIGQFDLYVCNRRGSGWSEPENLGPNVNTNRHEIYPMHYSNGRLYFASQGHENNLGGFDLYYSVWDGKQWNSPVHLDPPFNTKRNEAWYLVTDTSFTRGYIHSNREGRIYNIFEFSLDIPPELYEDCKIVEENSYCFTFYEAGAAALDTSVYRYEWVIEDVHFRQEEVDYCFPGTGQYQIALNVIDLLSGEVLFNQATYDLEIEDIEQVYISSPDTLFVNQPVEFSGTESNIKDFTIDRYIWDMGDKNWITDPTVSYRYFEPGTYTIMLGVVNEADQPEQVQKTCGFKNVVVLPQR